MPAISPVPTAVGPHPSAQRQAAQLRAASAHIALTTPDADARRPAAPRTGHRQGAALAATVAHTWPTGA